MNVQEPSPAQPLPQPGDFAVVRTATGATSAIEFFEALDDLVGGKKRGGWDKWDHAVVCTEGPRLRPDGTYSPMIVEAEPGGAVCRPWHYQGHDYRWSSGIIDLAPAERDVIRDEALSLAQARVGYGWLDYAALTEHALFPWVTLASLRRRIESSRTLICSQLVDWCYVRAGVHLFNDNRWPGYVKPSDLGWLLETAPAV